MTEESLDDPVRETHGHFDGLLRLVSASALHTGTSGSAAGVSPTSATQDIRADRGLLC